MTRIGDWLQTYSGRPFWPLDPRPEEIHIEDIAHSLAMRCRYGGHCTRFYSVAEHSVHVSRYVSPANALWGLLHDAPEAFSSDLPRPLKRSLPNWKPMEDRIMVAVCKRFGLVEMEPTGVKYVDLAITSDERAVMMNPSDLPWGDLPDPLGVEIMFLNPEDAKRAFIARFEELTGEKVHQRYP